MMNISDPKNGTRRRHLYIKLGQRERNALDVATPVSGESILEYVSRAEGVDSRFALYKSQVLSA